MRKPPSRAPLPRPPLCLQAASKIRKDNLVFGVDYDEQAELDWTEMLTADDIVDDDAVEGERPWYIGLPNSPWRLNWFVYEVLLLLFIAVSRRACALARARS